MKKLYLAIALLTMLCSCSENKWDFESKYLRVNINDKGYITSMKNITTSTAREFAPSNHQSPLLSLYDSDKKVYYYPQKAAYDSQSELLTLNYENGSVAQVRLQAQDKYLRLILHELAPRNGVDAVQWGPYQTNITNLLGEIIGVARDTTASVNYSIGMLALNDNTLGAHQISKEMLRLFNTSFIHPMQIDFHCLTT